MWENVDSLKFDTVLDVFGGTGAISHLFKRMGKQVTYNDYLVFNHIIGMALIENSHVTLTREDMGWLLDLNLPGVYPDFIERTFSGVYFTDEENQWLDRIIYQIDHCLNNPYKQAVARFALFQACIIKRPYNLFHRANLYMRLAKVERSFGNKSTWDTPFETHFRAFVQQANLGVFDNRRANRALNCNALETPIGADLVYIDPPYLNGKGVGVDYHGFYHFLEGLSDYPNWPLRIDYTSKHKRLLPRFSPWNSAATIFEAFEHLIARHQNSILVISYRDDGIPSKKQLIDIVGGYKKTIREAEKTQKYALSLRDSKELLLIATCRQG
ncbi:MAG: DNA adenine methylase [Chloroflexota bacterium]